MRIKLTLSYCGTAYSGWQRQKNAVSVQETLENALFALFKTETKTVASGRTDEGVHALGQVVHFDENSSVPPERIAAAVNTFLPRDIRAIESEEVADDFSARYDVKRKTYLYKLYTGRVENPTRAGLATFVHGTLDVDKMRKAAEYLLGEHDFEAFKAANSSAKTSTRTIYEARIKQNGSDLDFYVTGSGFLYNMVRIIVGTLVEIGVGRREAGDMKTIIESRDRKCAGKTAPPCGLYLYKVEY